MINLTDMEYRFADHRARAEWVNANGWKLKAQGQTGSRRGRPVVIIVGQMRTSLGEAMVRVGGWVKGMPRDHAANHAAGVEPQASIQGRITRA